MAAASPRATFSASSLVRVLSEMGVAGRGALDAEAGRNAQPSFAERLGSWLDWTDAIALSAALNAGETAAPAADPAAASRRTAAVAAAEACQRVRDDLVQLATADVAYTAAAARDLAVDFSPYRRDYLAHQRAMDSAIAPLRAQVRAALSSLTPEGARLAALDAVMDAALRPRERQLLATLPVWLERHFERLQQIEASAKASAEAGTEAGAEAGTEAGAEAGTEAGAAASAALHHRYHRDMQRLLLAELDLRLEPVEGMMEALRHETRPKP
jgi:transposase